MRDGWRGAARLLPAAYAAHVADERAAGFTPWVHRHIRAGYGPRDFRRINGAGLVLTAGATAWALRSPRSAVFRLWYHAVLTPQALWNPVFHLGASAAYGEPPGVRTAPAFWPLWWGVTRGAGLSRAEVAAGAAAGALLHAAAVAQQVYGVPRRFAGTSP